VRLLEERGFADVRQLAGGMQSWWRSEGRES
jgi:rhodanese-related sulfurtransferase